jgi:flagellar hook-associated protein 1
VSTINIPETITLNSTVKDLENLTGVKISDMTGNVLRLDNLSTTPLITDTMTLQTVFNRINAMSTKANGEQPLNINLDEVNHRIELTGVTRDALSEIGGEDGSELNLFRILGFEGQGITGTELATGSSLSSTLTDLGISSGWIQIDNANIAIDSGKTLKQTLDTINAALNASGSGSVGTNIYYDPTGNCLRVVSNHQFSTNTTPLPSTQTYTGAPVTDSNFLMLTGLQREEGVATDSVEQALASITSSDSGARLKINASLIDDPNLIASAATLAGVPDDNTVALAVAAIKDTYFMNDTSSGFILHPTETLDENFNNMIAKLGTEAQRANTDFEVNQNFLTYYQNKQQEVSGVSLDEEMTRMIESQQAFSAASRMVNTIDEMLDRIINSTGLVGR